MFSYLKSMSTAQEKCMNMHIAIAKIYVLNFSWAFSTYLSRSLRKRFWSAVIILMFLTPSFLVATENAKVIRYEFP